MRTAKLKATTTGRLDDDDVRLTDKELAGLRPMQEMWPASLIAQFGSKRRRGPQKSPTKRLISIRLDRHVIEAFKSTGRGWQSRMNAVLAAGLEPVTTGTGRASRPPAVARSARRSQAKR